MKWLNPENLKRRAPGRALGSATARFGDWARSFLGADRMSQIVPSSLRPCTDRRMPNELESLWTPRKRFPRSGRIAPPRWTKFQHTALARHTHLGSPQNWAALRPQGTMSFALGTVACDPVQRINVRPRISRPYGIETQSTDGWALRLHSCRALSSQPQSGFTPH
jgi:hypothetical protein